MKAGIKLFIVGFVSISLSTGCDKIKNKSDNENPSNYFEYSGNKYSLAYAFMENYGVISNGIYNLDLYLLSNSFETVENNNLIDSLLGTGNGLYFELFSSTHNKIDTALYSFESYLFGTLNTFNQGAVFIGYDSINKTGTRLEITEGFFKVEENDPEYEILLECTVSNGEKIKGYYKGTAKLYDYVKLH
jgi:hypothetical protein